MRPTRLLAIAAALAAMGATAVPVVPRAALFQAAAPSQHAAQELQAKIDRIKKAEKVPGTRQVEVSEIELESYVLFVLKEDIPGRLETFDVQLTPGAVAADTRMTFAADSTGNPVIDVFIAGTHTLFVKGRLRAINGVGKFDLDEVRLDGIPVPTILIESLIARYVKPKYPEVDLNEPFPMPWGMESLSIAAGNATVEY
jgi:hypothetical protein